MRRFASALFLAALAGTAASAAPPRSIVGTWAFKDRLAPGNRYDATDCGTDFAIDYARDGRFTTNDDEGRWSLRGDRLTEMVDREIGDDGEMAAVKPWRRTMRLRWLSSDMVNTEMDGEVTGMIRCPPAS